MSKEDKLRQATSLVATIEDYFITDRTKAFYSLDELRRLCGPFEYVEEKVSDLEFVLMDYTTTKARLFNASGAVISALKMYDDNHPSWRSWIS